MENNGRERADKDDVQECWIVSLGSGATTEENK